MVFFFATKTNYRYQLSVILLLDLNLDQVRLYYVNLLFFSQLTEAVAGHLQAYFSVFKLL